jgi:hypothetical protein
MDRRYPDFSVCQFFGADDNDTPGDVIRVVFEIGTKTDELSRLALVRQLKKYLFTVTNEVYMYSQKPPTYHKLHREPIANWISKL